MIVGWNRKNRWLNDHLLAPGKALLGHVGDAIVANGEKPNMGEFTQILGDLIPAALPRLKQLYPDNNVATLVSGRARAALNGEHKRLFTDRPSLSNTVDLVARAWTTQKPIHIDDIYDMIERDLIVSCGDGPGVYVRYRPEIPYMIYVGMSEKIAKRNRNHSNSPLRLVEVYPTVNASVARFIESELHRALMSSDKYVSGERGLFSFTLRTDALNLLRTIYATKRFSRLVDGFHNRNIVKEAIIPEQEIMLPMMSAF